MRCRSMLWHADIDPARRKFLRQLAYLGIAPLPLGLFGIPSGHSAARTGAPAADPRALTETASVYHGIHQTYGGEQAYRGLVHYVANDAHRLLNETSVASRPPILLACAQLVHVLATMTADAGRERQAQHYYDVALALAREGRSRSQYAITLRAMSAQALQSGQPRYATELAEAAVTAAGTASAPSTRAFVLVQRARSYASGGNVRGAFADLDAAEEEHRKETGPLGPFTAYPRAGMAYQRAETLHALGCRRMTIAALKEAAGHRAPAQRCPYALTQARLAEVLLESGRLEEACGHWHKFLDHYPVLGSGRARSSLRGLVRLLGTHRKQAAAASVLERVRCAGSSASQAAGRDAYRRA